MLSFLEKGDPELSKQARLAFVRHAPRGRQDASYPRIWNGSVSRLRGLGERDLIQTPKIIIAEC